MMTIGTPLMWTLFTAFVIVALAVDFFARHVEASALPDFELAGEYRLLPGTTPETLLAQFVAGDVILHLLTIPEGWTFRQALAADPQSPIELVIPYQLSGLEGGEGHLSAVMVQTLEGEARRLESDALLAFFGLSMNLGPIAAWGLSLEKHHIVVDPSTCETSAPGIFAIGDIATYPRKLKLILSGFAEAAQAAHAIHPLCRPGQVLHWEYSTTKGVPAAAAE